MNQRTTTKKINGIFSQWHFRREISLGTVLHVTTLLILIITTWSNLQKELALIRHDLNQLVQSNKELHQHMGTLTNQCREHEYRLKILETQPDLPG